MLRDFFSFVLFQAICRNQFQAMVSGLPALNLHVIQMVTGDGDSFLGYNLMGPAYDVALASAARLYPRVFANLTVTRYFVPGQYSCVEAEGLITAGLRNILRASNKESTGGPREYPVVLCPGCTFEVMALSDFAREENVPVFASTGAVPVPERYPNLLAFSAASFTALSQALAELLIRYEWFTFNLLCDNNPGLSLIPEVICALTMDYVSTMARKLSVVQHGFRSDQPESFPALLKETTKHSSITAFASTHYTDAYQRIITLAGNSGMATGEYVFVLLGVSPYDRMDTPTTLISDSNATLAMLPYVMLLDYDDINWTAVGTEFNETKRLSQELYNWTVLPDVERNIYALAAYESVLVMAQVMDENYNELPDMTAQSFASKFSLRTFPLPSRTVKVTATGSRVNDVTVKQYRHLTESFDSILIFDDLRKGLFIVPNTTVKWSDQVSFPPSFLPPCEICPKGSQDQLRSILTYFGSGVAVALVIFAILFREIHSKAERSTWWILLPLDVIDHAKRKSINAIIYASYILAKNEERAAADLPWMHDLIKPHD